LLVPTGQSAGFIASVVGAIILLALYRVFAKRRQPFDGVRRKR